MAWFDPKKAEEIGYERGTIWGQKGPGDWGWITPDTASIYSKWTTPKKRMPSTLAATQGPAAPAQGPAAPSGAQPPILPWASQAAAPLPGAGVTPPPPFAPGDERELEDEEDENDLPVVGSDGYTYLLNRKTGQTRRTDLPRKIEKITPTPTGTIVFTDETTGYQLLYATGADGKPYGTPKAIPPEKKKAQTVQEVPGAELGTVEIGGIVYRGYIDTQGNLIKFPGYQPEALGTAREWALKQTGQKPVITYADYVTGGKTYEGSKFEGGKIVDLGKEKEPEKPQWVPTGQVEEKTLVPGQTYDFLKDDTNPTGTWSGAVSVARLRKHVNEADPKAKSQWRFESKLAQEGFGGIPGGELIKGGVSPDTGQLSLYELTRQQAALGGRQLAERETQEKMGSRQIQWEAGQQQAQVMAQPRNWIRRLEQSKLPITTPKIIAKLTGRLTGDTLQKRPLMRPTAQDWNSFTDTEKQMLLGYLDWTGVDAEQWMAEILRAWQGGMNTGAVSWAPVMQRR